MKKTVKNLLAVLLCLSVVFATCVCAFAVGSVSSLTADAEYNSITLSWYSADVPDGYEVYVASGKTWKKIATTEEESFTHKNLDFNTTYKYRVRAFEKHLFTTVYGKYETITAKTGLSAPRGLKVTSAAETGFKLKWNKVPGATGYQIYLYAGGKWVYKYKTASNSQVVTGAKLGTVYQYRIRAYRTENGKNYYGPFSATLKAKCAITVPSAVKASSVTTSSAVLSWKAVSSASGYQVYLRNGAKWVKQANVTVNKCTLKGLDGGTRYDVRIRAFKKIGSTYFYSAWVDFSFKTAYKTVKVDPDKVPASTAEICSVYNAVVNNAKNEKNVTMKRSCSYDIESVMAPSSIQSIMDSLTRSLLAPTEETITVRNGVARESGGNKTDLNEWIAPAGRTAALKASYVSAASAKATSDGYKMSIRLKPEESTFDGKNTVPAKGHASCLDLTDFAALELGTAIQIDNAFIKYPGATLTAYINRSGKLKKLSVKLPFSSEISGTLSSLSLSLAIGLDGTMKDVYDFTY
ncbi:MAG: fibronectin type III domain-containing protein [Acutalibacteraceae bacterium]